MAELAELKELVSQLIAQQKDLAESVTRMEAMAMQAAMGKAKEHKSLTDNLERLEGMAMAAATSIAKLDKKYVEGQQGAEAMLMQAAMTNAKSAKDSSDRITNIESMLLSQAHSIGKVSAAVNKPSEEDPTPELDDESSGSDSDDTDPGDTQITLDADAKAKLKAAAYAKLAAQEGKSVEELKSHIKAAGEEERKRLFEAMNELASLSVARNQVKVTAAQAIAEENGFETIEAFKAHLATVDATEKDKLKGDMKEAATTLASGDGPATAARTGKSLWRKAKIAIPLVKAVQQFALVLAEAVPINPEDIAEGTPMAAGVIEIPVAVACP